VEIKEVKENKRQYLALLLLADEQEDMIDRYFDEGTMYVPDDGGMKSTCVATAAGNEMLEMMFDISVMMRLSIHCNT
jgi:hypothetical protein